MENFIVLGNPIKHSYSPLIYSMFAAENCILHTYTKKIALQNNFKNILQNFFLQGGLGANITIPFKEQAFFLCNHLTNNSLLSKTVNTIKKQTDGSLLGDNTDGIGLLYDLQRLNLIKHNTKILLIGAGGAAKGIIIPLLNYGCEIMLTNRTFSKAKEIFNSYKHLGNINIISLNDLFNHSQNYNLIINATSTSMYNITPNIPASLINDKTFCYDIFYKNTDTSFMIWCKQQGAKYCFNGIGMLIAQAAYSFLLWHNILPSISQALKYFSRDN